MSPVESGDFPTVRDLTQKHFKATEVDKQVPEGSKLNECVTLRSFSCNISLTLQKFDITITYLGEGTLASMKHLVVSIST